MEKNKNLILYDLLEEVLPLILELLGKKIIQADPHICFWHIATEKLIEYKTYLYRLDYVSMIAQEHIFGLAIEYLLNLNVSLYAQYIRVILCYLF